MSFHRLAVTMRLSEQMRCVRRGNALRGKVTTDVQIGGILSFLNCLMMRALLSKRFFLGADVIVQFPVASFKFAPDPLYIFFNDRKFRGRCD